MTQHLSAINAVMPQVENFNLTRKPEYPGVSFSGVLNQFASLSPIDSSAVGDSKNAEAARSAAAQFVGMAFIQPMLAQLRETSTATGPFAPTSAEKRFGPMMDQLMSDRISTAANFPLIDSVAQRMTATQINAGVQIHG